ncbi:MAG TPA: GNAT family N-acetyltransferase [Flavobacteriaceae bacterium]|nr:GNAT family N-acetyltransferase [Flavobacteriaceae bacterium]
MSIYLNNKISTSEICNLSIGDLINKNFYESIYSYLKGAKQYYPDFNIWYMDKVVTELLNLDRELLIEHRGHDVAGIAIIKKSEKKLCTLKVIDSYQNKGIGLKLFEKSFNALGTDKPFLTVSEEKLPEFEKLFQYYGFQLTSIHDGLYRDKKKEYFFNER